MPSEAAILPGLPGAGGWAPTSRPPCGTAHLGGASPRPGCGPGGPWRAALRHPGMKRRWRRRRCGSRISARPSARKPEPARSTARSASRRPCPATRTTTARAARKAAAGRRLRDQTPPGGGGRLAGEPGLPRSRIGDQGRPRGAKAAQWALARSRPCTQNGMESQSVPAAPPHSDR